MTKEIEEVQSQNKFMYWLENTLAENVRSWMARPWVSGFTNGVIKALPFILVGALIFTYNAIKSWIPGLPDFGLINYYTFCMLSLIYVFMIPHEIMATTKNRPYMVTAGLTGVCAYLLTMAGEIDADSILHVDFNRFGPSGTLVAMLVGIEVAIVFNLWGKVKLFKQGSAVPTFVQQWVNNIIPIFVTMLIQMIVVGIAGLDLYEILLSIFAPLTNVAQTLPGFIFTNWFQTFFFTIGVSGWTWGGLTNSFQVPAMAENLAQGFTGVNGLLNVSEITHGIGLINMGGMGATLALNVLMLLSKSKRLRTLGRVTIVPSLFNINEPVIFGAPVIYNPVLLIPANLAPIIGSIITWFIFRLGLLNLPIVQLTNVGTLPIIINTIMLTGDMRGLLWWFVMFAVFMALYFPFFKAFEKQEVEKELAEAAEA